MSHPHPELSGLRSPLVVFLNSFRLRSQTHQEAPLCHFVAFVLPGPPWPLPGATSSIWPIAIRIGMLVGFFRVHQLPRASLDASETATAFGVQRSALEGFTCQPQTPKPDLPSPKPSKDPKSINPKHPKLSL